MWIIYLVRRPIFKGNALTTRKTENSWISRHRKEVLKGEFAITVLHEITCILQGGIV